MRLFTTGFGVVASTVFLLLAACSSRLAAPDPAPPLFQEQEAAVQAAPSLGTTEITWYGQSAFKIVTPEGHILLIDPWIKNPSNHHAQADLDALTKADLILITHGHFDHVGEAAEIAQRTGAKLVAPLELGLALAQYGNFPKEQMDYSTLGNVGGILPFFNGEVAIKIVAAVHSSSVNPKNLGINDDDHAYYAGNPAGYVIAVKDGPTIYHTGDTAVFEDMKRIAGGMPHFHGVDLMLACIGGHFTMGPHDAAEAVELVHPKCVVPMHFGTFPMFDGTPEAFGKALEERHLPAARVMKVGETIRL